jgi:HTH-type transcriptional regulator/antitoxin HigA
MKSTNYIPFKATFLGEVLKDELDARGISQKYFAVEIGIQKMMLNEIIKGKRPITVDFAILLEKYLGISAEYWIRFQSQYDIDVARIKEKTFSELQILNGGKLSKN